MRNQAITADGDKPDLYVIFGIPVACATLRHAEDHVKRLMPKGL